ncbi:MAG: hypothetical protein PHN78_01970 [Dehalococcoidales bacterium]|nr:hypothetical protein [Dehalococcoidales bacterium]
MLQAPSGPSYVIHRLNKTYFSRFNNWLSLKIRVVFGVVALTLVLLVAVLSGCSFDRWVEVTEGNYIPIEISEIHKDTGSHLIESMNIDRKKNRVEIRFKNDSVIDESFTARPRQTWPSGCPANLGSTRMEVLDIDVDKLVIGSLIINNPILVRNCPGIPEKVFLREDGQIGGSGTACSGTETCIHFQPGSPIDSNLGGIFP